MTLDFWKMLGYLCKFILIKMKNCLKMENLEGFIRDRGIHIILIFGIILFILLIIIFLQKPDSSWVTKLFGAEKKIDVIELIGWAAGGLLAIFGILVANRRAKAMENQATAANRQAEIANRQVEIANEDSRENRFKDMVEHLGHEKSSVCLSGIYGLYQLAQDYSEVDDRKNRGTNIIDIICAYIRQTTKGEGYIKENKDFPSEEIQSTLDLLFKPVEKKTILRGTNNQINLSQCWLAGANLFSAQLQRADLTQAQLQGADLRSAQLHGAKLKKADLTCAQLEKANIRGAHLEEAKLLGAVLTDAQLQRVYLNSAQLHGVSFVRASMHGAIISNAQLQGAKLMEACLQGANLHSAQLQRANLEDAKMQGTHLNEAQLQGATLTNVELHGASLYQTELQGATFCNTELQGAYSNDNSLNISFEDRIQTRVNQISELETVIFEGFESTEQIEQSLEELKSSIEFFDASSIENDLVKRLRDIYKYIPKIMKNHLQKDVSHEPPSKAVTGNLLPRRCQSLDQRVRRSNGPRKFGQ